MDESKVQQNTPRSNLLYPTSSISSNNGTPGSSQRNSLRSSPANIPPVSAIPLVYRPPLNQYLKIAVIRSPTDVVLCNDPEQPGKKREVVVSSLPNQKQENGQQDSQEKTDSNKRDIPVPKITSVKRYGRDVPSNYNIPQSYIRFNHPSYEEVDEAVEYNIDEEDENWWKKDEDFGPESRAKVIWEGDMIIDEESEKTLQSLAPIDVITRNPRYYNSAHGTYWLIEKHRPRLPLCVLERMMDVLEKATGFEMIVTVAQAEKILAQKIPILTEIFANKPPVIKEPRYVNDGIAIQRNTADTSSKSSDRIPAFGPPITLSAAIYKVYNYWMQKRSRLKKPLLRRFWPATSTTDINPHMVFRPRDKEKRNLRKKRQNDITSYNKMKLLKMDFEKVKTLCDLIVRREGVTSLMVDLSNEYYHQRLHEWLDTSGRPTQSGVLTKEIVEKVLDVPKYFDDEPLTSKAPKNKKRKRTSAVGSSVLEVDHSSFLDATDTSNSDAGVATAATEVQPTKDVVVAGHDGGLPAPSFLDPLSSREVYETNWSDKEPYIPYVENGKEFVPKTFQHRARMGRGGRIMIDRIPCASDTQRFITYGCGTSASGYHPSTLGVDGKVFNNKHSLNSNIKNNKEDAPRAPPPQNMADLAPPSLDSISLSRRIQEICARGILDDFEQQKQGHNDTDEILMPLEDFLDSPYYGNGNENYVIGPF